MYVLRLLLTIQRHYQDLLQKSISDDYKIKFVDNTGPNIRALLDKKYWHFVVFANQRLVYQNK